MKLKLTILLAAACALIASTGGIASAQYGGNQGFIINPSQTLPGGEVSFLGTGCAPGSQVTFTIANPAIDLGTTTADNTSEGNFFLGNVVIPIGTPPGVYTVTATCGDTILVASLTVLDVPLPPPSSGGLAVTGSSRTIPMAKIAIVLIAVGGAILLATGRRRERAER